MPRGRLQVHCLPMIAEALRVGKGQPLTLVATDVEGSTDLWEWDKQAMMEAISLHDNILRADLSRFHGYEVATEVDCSLPR